MPNGRRQRLLADRQSAGELLIEYVVEYARERPEVVALWAFGIGFAWAGSLSRGEWCGSGFRPSGTSQL
ncbi:MAG: hypothetical protein R3C10_13740 [Pirellulales bacterium]